MLILTDYRGVQHLHSYGDAIIDPWEDARCPLVTVQHRWNAINPPLHQTQALNAQYWHIKCRILLTLLGRWLCEHYTEIKLRMVVMRVKGKEWSKWRGRCCEVQWMAGNMSHVITRSAVRSGCFHKYALYWPKASGIQLQVMKYSSLKVVSFHWFHFYS